MPVQISPGNRLTNIALQAEGIKDRREGLRLRDVALNQQASRDRFNQSATVEQLSQGRQRIAQVAKNLKISEQQAEQEMVAKVIKGARESNETGDPAQTKQIAIAMYGQLLGDPQAAAERFADAPDELFISNPSRAEQLDDRRIKLLEQGSAGEREFGSLTEGLSPEDIENARRVRLGLDPRAVTSADRVVMIGDVPHVFDEQTNSMKRVQVDGQTVDAESVGRDRGTIAATVDASKQAIAQSGKAVESIGAVKKSLTNIDDAIAALDAGAETGSIASRLPSIRTASIKLDNAQRRRGLEILGATTFGALSKGELDLALKTALPDNLDGPELRAWLVDKREAQESLANELKRAAIYLGKPGNTPAGYLELLRNQEQGGQEESPQPNTPQSGTIQREPRQGQPDRAALEAEARRRGLIK